MALFIAKTPRYRSSEKVPAQIGVRYSDLRPSRAENEAINRLGNLLVTRAEEMKKERDTAVVGDLYNRFRESERSALTEISKKKGKDAVNLDQDYDRFFNKSLGAADQEAENGYQQSEINRMLGQHRQQSLDSIAKYEAKELQNYKAEQEIGVINNAVSDARIEPFNEGKFENTRIETFDYIAKSNPGMSEEALWAKLKAVESQIVFSNMQERINVNPEQGIIDIETWKVQLGEKYYSLKNSAKTQIDSNQLNTAYTVLSLKHGQNYEAAISEINNPKSESVKSLSYEQRNSLNSRFYGLYNQREAFESNSAADKTKSTANKDFETWIKFTNGTLPMEPVADAQGEDLESLARNRQISKETYLGIKNINKKGTEFDNPYVVGEIVRKISRGEDVRTLLENGLRDGNIKDNTFVSLSADSENKAAQEGYGILQKSMQPTAADVFDNDKHVRFADAVDLFNIRRRAEPERLPIDIAREILYSYQDELRRSRKGLPRPKYFEGKDYDAASLKAAASETAKAFERGEISKEEYDFEIKRILNWGEITDTLNGITENMQREVDRRKENNAR